MERLVKLGVSLSDPLSVRMLGLLRGRGELCLCELQGALLLPRYKVERPLKKLIGAGLIEAHFHGRWLGYQLRPEAKEFIDELFEVYGEEMDWDSELSLAQARIRKLIGERVEGWCPSNVRLGAVGAEGAMPGPNSSQQP